MLIRTHDDASTDERRWRAFVVTQGFGHFVASGRNRRVPVIVPTQFLLEDDTIAFHLAASNPVFECLEENPMAVMSVAGDWAYIPGEWKAIGTEDPRRGIPTMYYAAVQLTGRVTVADDSDAVAGVLRRQLAALERDVEYVEPSEHGAKLRAIRAITVAVTDVRAKFKFGGNVDEPHRKYVAEKLRKRRAPGDEAALAHLAGRGTAVEPTARPAE